jgi:hypothetical protein
MMEPVAVIEPVGFPTPTVCPEEVVVCAVTAARRCASAKHLDILDILDRGILKIGALIMEGEKECR